MSLFEDSILVCKQNRLHLRAIEIKQVVTQFENSTILNQFHSVVHIVNCMCLNLVITRLITCYTQANLSHTAPNVTEKRYTLDAKFPHGFHAHIWDQITPVIDTR